MPTKYVILTTGRSGSSWLMEMLNSHPAIGGYGELFSTRYKTTYPQTQAALYRDPGGVPHFGAYLAEHGAKPLIVPVVGVRYMAQLYAPREGLEAVGFRLMYRDLRRRWGSLLPVGAWLLPYMALNDVRIVHLVRRNSLDVLVSDAMAGLRGVYHARNGDDVAPARVRVNTDALVSRLAWQETKESRVRRGISLLGLPCLEIGYEDLRADTKAEYRRVVEFLGADPVDHKPRWRMKKVIETPREDTIENYESVKQALRGTKYEPLLAERR